MPSINELDRIISKIARAFPYAYYYDKIIPSKDVDAILKAFDLKKDPSARLRLMNLFDQNAKAQISFAKNNKRLADSWISGILQSQKRHISNAIIKENQKKQRAKLKREAAIRQARLQAEGARLVKSAEEKQKLFKKLNLTPEQKAILKQLSE